MHELSLCQGIVELIEEHARSDPFTQVTRVCLEVGALACVEPDALRFGFDLSARGTLVEGARLEIVEVAAVAWCFGCNQTVTLKQRGDHCPCCSSSRLRVTGGEELRIKELEVI
ncbi:MULTISPECIES: hydrogenase maturation nickel metallochaperone HypA [unclassified Halomonas]|uniref:hydrogenase maturation nickel metallochaperone HypA n=1 Tax=unclassified Halomonas TaxID=2609666 RepID=UPI001C94A140|nr:MULTISPECIES: hydrogenase maturation nickel metallochaperone HypA [unclassified Halomonas]MBY5926177.1 hydrogenase maturation nickel metallochaperone HypA [Halomonas sp. DP4Y7-2]MBY6233219.1 hydrogenase maturation nickel metallochaperone HypA [Halomonas sp. DP4Y7-1]